MYLENFLLKLYSRPINDIIRFKSPIQYLNLEGLWLCQFVSCDQKIMAITVQYKVQLMLMVAGMADQITAISPLSQTRTVSKKTEAASYNQARYASSPDCSEAPHYTSLLFSCSSTPTNLKVDLWEDSVAAATFLPTIPSLVGAFAHRLFLCPSKVPYSPRTPLATYNNMVATFDVFCLNY